MAWRRQDRMARRRQDRMARQRQDRMKRRQTAQRGKKERERETERERKYSQFIKKLSRALPNIRARSGYIQVPPVGLPTPATHCTLLFCLLFPSSVAFSYTPSFHPSPDLPPNTPWFCILPPLLHASFRFRDIAQGRGGTAPSGAALSLGRRGAILSASHDEGAVLSSSAVLCKSMMPPSSHDEGRAVVECCSVQGHDAAVVAR